MSQLPLFVVVLTAVVWIQGAPLSPPSSYSFDGFVDAATAGEWDKVHDFFAKSFVKDGFKHHLKELTDVRELKPPKGGHVYAQSEYSYHSLTDQDGQKSEKSGGHKIINDDGSVAEFDFKPTGRPEDLFKKLSFPFDNNSS